MKSVALVIRRCLHYTCSVYKRQNNLYCEKISYKLQLALRKQEISEKQNRIEGVTTASSKNKLDVSILNKNTYTHTNNRTTAVMFSIERNLQKERQTRVRIRCKYLIYLV